MSGTATPLFDVVPNANRVIARCAGVTIADSTLVLTVHETGKAAVQYFPRIDIVMERLRPSGRTTQCPGKGTAHYFSVEIGGRVIEAAAWSYDHTTEAADAISGYVAFDPQHVVLIEESAT
jgi:uncharacterized protein (DUF427 family)